MHVVPYLAAESRGRWNEEIKEASTQVSSLCRIRTSSVLSELSEPPDLSESLKLLEVLETIRHWRLVDSA